MACIIYARFSDRPNASDCKSCIAQREFCTRWAKEKGESVRRVFSDEGLSGADETRPGLWNAVAALKPGDTLLVWKFDRLARDAFLAMTIERAVMKIGANIVSASGEGTIDKALSPEAQLQIGIIRLFSEYERKLIGYRTKCAMIHHQASGRRMGRADRLPYGKMLDPNDAARMIDCPEEIANIERIRAWASFGDLSIVEIQTNMNQSGFLCRGGAWKYPLVRKIAGMK